MAYSGQCLSSEAWGGRSANRGQCAQACRLPYDLIVDGRLQPLGDARYLLSPGDLYALHQIPEIVRIGISALKIEGRYKDADYVALTTRAYRQAVDEAWAGLPPSVSRVEEIQLEQVYSRGMGPHFLTGTNHQAVVRGRAPRHRGVRMGRVARLTAESVIVEPDPVSELAPLKPGDGLVFDAADWRSPEEPEEGGRLYEVSPARDGRLELRFANSAINFTRIRPGDLVWRTHDPDLDKAVRPFTHATAPVARQKLQVRVTAREGAPLVSEWTLVDRPAITVTVTSPSPLDAAEKRPLSADLLREQFGRLGNTPYELAGVNLDIDGRPFAPASLLNQLRQRAVEALGDRLLCPKALPLRRVDRVACPRFSQVRPLPKTGDRLRCPRGAKDAPWDSESCPQLHLLVRTPDQLDAAIALKPASITLDYLDLYGLRPSIDRVKESGIVARVASPRVLKPGEERIEDFLLGLDCAIVVRSAGLLRALSERSLIGDFSLNVANAVTADLLLRLGLSRITPTHDLNAAQVATLASEAGADSIEAVAYQHLPVFHIEHCVFCRFLSAGTSYLDCGRPCEKHRIAVRDAAGRSHPVMADVGCRNTVFGAEAQEASAHLEAWRRAGIHHFRLEFVHESADQVTRVTRAFEAALSGETSYQQLAQKLRAISPQGTTEGSLFVPKDYLALPVLQ